MDQPDVPTPKRARVASDEDEPALAGVPPSASAGGGGGGAPSPAPAGAPLARAIDYLLLRASAFGNESGPLPCCEFSPGAVAAGALANAKVLVLGAGGLGCEVLHGLACAGFGRGAEPIDVIDGDTVDLTNLNRQFLFRRADIGAPKAAAAARAVEARAPGVRVRPHVGRLEARPAAWYAGFDVIIGGLDNLAARRWVNATLCAAVPRAPDGGPADVDAVVPYVDGGSEGFKGQVQVVLPALTACFECTLDTFPPATAFQICTIAETPRRPEHCVAYAMLLQWERTFPGRKLDKDSADDLLWLHAAAAERARAYGIEGVTYALTTGVVKSIIPAVASTNAVIASMCVLEAFKIVTGAAHTLNHYWQYMGHEGLATAVQTFERKTDTCGACGGRRLALDVRAADTLAALIARLKEDPRLQLADPSLRTADAAGAPLSLFLAKPAALRAATTPNLARPLGELLPGDGAEVIVTDPVLANADGLTLVLHFR